MAVLDKLSNGVFGIISESHIFIGQETYPNRLARIQDVIDIAGSGGVGGLVTSVNGQTGAVLINLQSVTNQGNTTTTGIGAQFIQLNVNPTDVNEVEGKLFYNYEYDTLNIVHRSGIVQEVGQKTFLPPVHNTTLVTINKGDFVMATGATGDQITIAKAITNGSVDPMFMVGFAARDIAPDSELGKVVTNGLIKGINTNAWPVGTVLYPDPLNAGKLTSTAPTAPSIKTPVAIVLKQNSSSGIIYVRMTNGSKLGETDSNVQFTSLSTDQTIRYTGSIWENTSKLVTKSDGTIGVEKDITLNNGSTAEPSTDLGMRINRGTSNAEAAILWKEGVKYWIAKDTDVDPGQAEKKIAVEWDVLDGGTWS